MTYFLGQGLIERFCFHLFNAGRSIVGFLDSLQRVSMVCKEHVIEQA